MLSVNPDRKNWSDRYNYRDAGAIDSCELCSYANHIDVDLDRRVESLTCSAWGDDTGMTCAVEFGSICDLYLPEIMEDRPEEQ